MYDVINICGSHGGWRLEKCTWTLYDMFAEYSRWNDLIFLNRMRFQSTRGFAMLGM